VDIPGASSNHVELVPDRADDLHHIVQHPRRAEGIDARPQPVSPKSCAFPYEARAQPAGISGNASSRLPSTT
jgi:hypothetical protein